MALFCADQTQPDRDAPKIVRVLSHKHVKDGDYTSYIIQVNVGDISWTLERRYSEFEKFDRERFCEKLRKQSILPGKKLIGNQDEDFLQERQSELEKYLRAILQLELFIAQKRRLTAIPKLLGRFLDFDQYEVHAICERLSESWADQLDSAASAAASDGFVELTPLQLYAVTQRLALPEPTTAASGADIGVVTEFLHKRTRLKIRGGGRGSYKRSNIQLRSLPFSLQFCKSLQTFWVTDCNPTMISGMENVKETVTCLIVHYTVKHLKRLLCCGQLDACGSSSLKLEQCQTWNSLKEADFSFNLLKEIDASIILLPYVEVLDLSNNSLTDIGTELVNLARLRVLNLSNNGIEHVESWHMKLGNVKRLILTGNSIRSLEGLSRVLSLELLDVRDNSLRCPSDVRHAGQLPVLHTLLLNGNPVTHAVEYRTRVLEAFDRRAADVRLDGKRASARERDLVAVRLAIRKAREEKEALLERTRADISHKLRLLTPDEQRDNNADDDDSNAAQYGECSVSLP